MSSEKNPLLSIIIPTFNRSDLLIKTLSSVANQTYSNWECLVVDDGSLDNTREVVAQFAGNNPRFRLLTNTRKKGAQGARNTGLLAAKGSYISFFDSDNLMLPQRFTVQLNYMEAHPSCDVCTCYSHLVNDNDEVTGAFTWVADGNILAGILAGWTYVDYNSAVIKKTAMDKAGLLDEDCPSYQEWDTFIRLAQTASFCTVHELLVQYYERSSGRISTDNKRELRGLSYIYARHKKLWISVGGKSAYLAKISSLAQRLAAEDKVLQKEIIALLPEVKQPLLLIKIKHKISKLWA